MEDFETGLTGIDGTIDGLVTRTTVDAHHYVFSSFDGSLTLELDRDEQGNWKRISSSEPYLSGWAEELGEQIDQHNSSNF